MSELITYFTASINAYYVVIVAMVLLMISLKVQQSNSIFPGAVLQGARGAKAPPIGEDLPPLENLWVFIKDDGRMGWHGQNLKSTLL